MRIYLKDEVLVNAADNFQRDNKMDLIRVDINTHQGCISVWNNGKGIPIEMHKEHGCYVPELIFGQLLTSSNYDDQEQKVTGGRNGFGAKLANIFSSMFTVETGDSKTRQVYRQTWRCNMSVTEPPLISKTQTPNFTKVTFWPDFKRFRMTGFEEDIISLFTKRVFDIAGVTDGRVRVELNGQQVPVKTFLDYSDLYLKTAENKALPKVIEKKSDRWEVVCSLSDGSF